MIPLLINEEKEGMGRTGNCTGKLMSSQGIVASLYAHVCLDVVDTSHCMHNELSL